MDADAWLLEEEDDGGLGDLGLAPAAAADDDADHWLVPVGARVSKRRSREVRSAWALPDNAAEAGFLDSTLSLLDATPVDLGDLDALDSLELDDAVLAVTTPVKDAAAAAAWVPAESPLGREKEVFMGPVVTDLELAARARLDAHMRRFEPARVKSPAAAPVVASAAAVRPARLPASRLRPPTQPRSVFVAAPPAAVTATAAPVAPVVQAATIVPPAPAAPTAPTAATAPTVLARSSTAPTTTAPASRLPMMTMPKSKPSTSSSSAKPPLTPSTSSSSAKPPLTPGKPVAAAPTAAPAERRVAKVRESASPMVDSPSAQPTPRQPLATSARTNTASSRFSQHTANGGDGSGDLGSDVHYSLPPPPSRPRVLNTPEKRALEATKKHTGWSPVRKPPVPEYEQYTTLTTHTRGKHAF